MSARTEMDAMVVTWLKDHVGAEQPAAIGAMQMFRDYRAAIDQEKVEHTSDGTEAGEG